MEIPNELDTIVNKAISEGKYLRKRNKMIKFIKKSSTAAAAIILCFIILLNVSPTIAQAAYKIPALENLCRVIIFREYHFEDEIKYVDVHVPKIENTGKSALEKKVNLEVQKKINECVAENEKIAKEYYEAFIETGGNPEEFAPVGIVVDYYLKCINKAYVSFVITQYNTAFSAYHTELYYNIDLETGDIFTLKDWYGDNYKMIVAESIEHTIASWSDEQKDILWNDISFMDLISEDTDFYINADNQAVVVFAPYEIAYGAAGTLEFTITLLKEKTKNLS